MYFGLLKKKNKTSVKYNLLLFALTYLVNLVNHRCGHTTYNCLYRNLNYILKGSNSTNRSNLMYQLY